MTQSTTPAVGNDLFLHNMRALWRVDASLALQVDAIDDDDRLPVEQTKSGEWTVRLAAADGRMTYLHSRYDPVSEAQRYAASIEMEGKFCLVVTGLGLGHHIRALADLLHRDILIICTEPSIALIATALCHVDLSDAIASRRLIILTDTDKAGLHERLGPHNTLIMLGTQFSRHAPSMRIAGSEQAALTNVISEFVSYTRMTIVTAVRNARITCKNIAMNLVHYVATPPIDLLRDRFAGNPCVIVSAGPSLSRNIDQLAALKGKAVLCAVQTTLKPLMQRHIVPDFVTCLDFHGMSLKFFKGVDHLDKIHLVAEPKATWHVVDNYPGPVSLLDNEWARLVIGDRLGGRGGLAAGATVAHLAFYLAVYMGCDPIVFVGQDLAYSGHVFYVPGVEVHQAWRSELNRFHSIEQKEWDRIVRNRPILHKVAGAAGGELYTDELLFTYLEQFEKDIADVPRRVINATEGGARIRGTQTMTLAEVADTFCSEPIDPARFAYRTSTVWRDPARLDETGDELNQRLKELREAQQVCDEILSLLDQLEKLTDRPDQFNRRLVRVDELRAKVHQESRAFRLINASAQLSELRRFSADRKISAAEISHVERAKRQIARDREFITGFRDGARDVTEILNEALERITEAPRNE
ncbi:MAG: DUF115 domain-containing protein [Planctomycetes bacterium]|nr:DUF115 domain-containing protein [Planctomycetota bacterium]